MQSDLIRIVIASGVRGDTRRYRTFHLYEQCRLLGLNACLSQVMLPEFQSVVHQAQLVILHRAVWDTNIQRAIDEVHSRGGKVIYDSDDLLFDPAAFKWIDSPDFKDPVRAGLYREDMARHRRTMELCDAIMTSTEYLAEQAGDLKLPTFVHHNGFSNEMLRASLKANDPGKTELNKIIIGYASGTPTHDRDFETISPALRMVLQKNANAFLWLVGPIKLNHDWEGFKNRIIHLPHLPWRILPGYLSRFDINLAPLVIDNPFSQSKSEIKWMEGALVKVPTIASPTNAFKNAIKNGENGILAESHSDWLAALSALIAERDMRQGIGRSAYEHVLSSYNPEVRAREFLWILQKVLPGFKLKSTQTKITASRTRSETHPGGSAEGGKIFNEKRPSLITMALYSLHYRGLSTLFKQIWVFFRRLVSPLIPYQKNRI